MIYTYVEALTERYVAAVMFKHSRQQNQVEDWCLEVFGQERRGFLYVGESRREVDMKRARTQGLWDMGHGDFFFSNEADLTMFVLRWKGEL